MFKPIFESASERHDGVTFASCDTEDESELAAMFRIQSIPTTIVFRDKIPVFSQPGMLPAPALDELLGKVKELDMDEVKKAVARQSANA
jgi:thioredoxin 1